MLSFSESFDASVLVSAEGCREVGENLQRFSGGVAVGNLVVFVPFGCDAIGVYDVITNELEFTVTTGEVTVNQKFDGAAAVGNLVVFVPCT